MVEIVGHRGAKGLVPENTLPSFERAIELGCDTTECDVHLTADGHLVVIHDATVDRTTNGSGAVAELTLAELRALDAGDGAHIPTFEELLAVIAGRIRLLCEMKAPGTPGPAVAAVRRAGLTDTVAFTSFQLDLLAEVRALGADLRLAGIFSQPTPEAFGRLSELRVEAVDVNWQHLDAEFVRDIQSRGFIARGWNPDTVEDMRATLALGVDSLSSNRPDLAIALVRG